MSAFCLDHFSYIGFNPFPSSRQECLPGQNSASTPIFVDARRPFHSNLITIFYANADLNKIPYLIVETQMCTNVHKRPNAHNGAQSASLFCKLLMAGMSAK